MTREKAEEIVLDFQAGKASDAHPELEVINKGYKLLQAGKFDENEAKVFLAGEKIRKQGKTVRPIDIFNLTGINPYKAKEIMKSIAKKVTYEKSK